MTHGRARDERRPVSCDERVAAFPRPRRLRRPGGSWGIASRTSPTSLAPLIAHCDSAPPLPEEALSEGALSEGALSEGAATATTALAADDTLCASRETEQPAPSQVVAGPLGSLFPPQLSLQCSEGLNLRDD
jgi:hypothetical protein